MLSFLMGLSLLFATSVFADSSLLTRDEIVSIMGNPPAKGSAEEKNDFDTLLKIQKERTSEECRLASAQEKISLENFFVANNGPLTAYEAQKLELQFNKAYEETRANAGLAKDLFKRPRPYLVKKEIRPCIAKVGTEAYPSGHATAARVFARLLSKLYPERTEEFMQRSDEVGHNRVLGGVHHPTDIIAGNKLGDALAVKMLKNEALIFE